MLKFPKSIAGRVFETPDLIRAYISRTEYASSALIQIESNMLVKMCKMLTL